MSRWDDIVSARIELDPPELPITKGYAERYVDRYADIAFGPPVEPSCRLCGAHGRVARVRIHGEDSAVCLPCNDHLAQQAMYPVTGGTGSAQQDAEYDGLAAWSTPPRSIEFVEIAWGLAALGRPVVIDAAERSERTAARYAAFRETVERVVREEAPRATVVTDICRGKHPGMPFTAWVTFEPGHTLEFIERERAVDELTLRHDIARELRHRGARAMGKAK